MQEELTKVMNNTYIRYKGCLIEFDNGFFFALHKPFTTLDLAKAHIDKELKNIKLGL